ncbi:MAG: hypothetical protein LAT76_05900 [Schleiferiaceae bacterium]|nr:hypothetical protein [Schleiferiaceae bacterium]
MPIITPSNSEESKIEFSPPQRSVDFLLNYSKSIEVVDLTVAPEKIIVSLN